MTARVLGVPLLCAAVVLASAAASAQRQVPPRTFPQFAGTWALDEAASTGELRIAPRIPRLMTIAITPETISVTRRPRLLPNDRSSDSPPPEVYRLDGSETRLTDPRTNVPLDVSYRFTLVADMLALTTKESREGWNNGFYPRHRRPCRGRRHPHASSSTRERVARGDDLHDDTAGQQLAPHLRLPPADAGRACSLSAALPAATCGGKHRTGDPQRLCSPEQWRAVTRDDGGNATRLRGA